MKLLKLHPSVVAWLNWLKSPEGKKCSEGAAKGQYLENRLWYAFKAGREAEREAIKVRGLQLVEKFVKEIL